MEGLGELGFWLAVGLVLAAMIVSGALKERDKEREKQATLRALLEKEGRSATEILAYLREKDAAEAASAEGKRAAWGANPSGRGMAAFMGASMVVVLSCIGGVIAFGHLKGPVRFSPTAMGRAPAIPAPEALPGPDILPLVTMFGIWATGLIIAALILLWGHVGKKKNDSQPDV